MQQRDGGGGNLTKKYCCSNPNCKSVFSQPKIIMYRVCPICQTMIDSTAAVYQAGTVEEEHAPAEQPITKRRLEKPEQSQNEEPKAMAQPKTEEPMTTEAKTILPPKTIEPGTVEPKTALPPKMAEPKIVQTKTIEPEPIESKAIVQPKTIEAKTVEPKITLPQKTLAQPNTTQQKTTESKMTVQPTVKSEADNASSDKTCQHYFGYLGQREKGEGIPSSCVECSKSLDCMLAEYYKSKETVEEIRKWYRPKL